ncbi:hypothetical protein ACLOJK_013228 [Asimina triloba]
MAKFMWVFCVLAIWAVIHAAAAPPASDAPAPAIDCSSEMFQMADCVSFVMNGSTESKPSKSCCAGFKTVLQGNPICLCESYKNSNNLGITLNMTRAMLLPKACGVSASASNCDGEQGIPVAAPGSAPVASPSASPSVAPASPGGSAAAVAPTPSQSDAVLFSSSISMVAVCLAAAIFSYN